MRGRERHGERVQYIIKERESTQECREESEEHYVGKLWSPRCFRHYRSHIEFIWRRGEKRRRGREEERRDEEERGGRGGERRERRRGREEERRRDERVRGGRGEEGEVEERGGRG